MAETFCLCGLPDEGGREMIECSSGQGGCGGWIHCDCFQMTPGQREEALADPLWSCDMCRGEIEDFGAAKRHARAISEAWRKAAAATAAAAAAADAAATGGAAKPTSKKSTGAGGASTPAGKKKAKAGSDGKAAPATPGAAATPKAKAPKTPKTPKASTGKGKPGPKSGAKKAATPAEPTPDGAVRMVLAHLVGLGG